MIFIKLTKLPVMNPRKPMEKRKTFLKILKGPISCQLVTVSIIGGAISAKVDELIAPTREMKRSNLGIAAAKATEKNKFHIIMKDQFCGLHFLMDEWYPKWPLVNCELKFWIIYLSGQIIMGGNCKES